MNVQYYMAKGSENIKLYAFDLDGTLLNSNKKISLDMLNMLGKIKEDNNILVFATARPPRDTLKLIPKEFHNEYIICYNGGFIKKGKQIIKSNVIDKDQIENIINLLIENNLNNICLEIEDKLYSNFKVEDYFGNTAYQIVDFKSMDKSKVSKIIVCDNNISNKIINKLPKSCVGIITDDKSLLQIMESNVSKWNSISYIMDNLDISKEDVISFGNDNNDIDMIKNSGIGVAMANSTEQLKNIADFITESNDKDGVLKYIRRNYEANR